MLPVFARRFRRAAVVIAVLAVIPPVVLIIAGLALIPGSGITAAIVAWVVAAALIGAMIAAALAAVPRSAALRRVREVNPDGVVFLARRQPSVVSDLASYLNGSDVLDEVADRWVIASVDDRGMSAWSVGEDSRELVLMPWTVIGAIDPAALEGGRSGVAVDVKPFPTPLLVSVGYSAFGVMAAFSRIGVAEVVAAAESQRPRR